MAVENRRVAAIPAHYTLGKKLTCAAGGGVRRASRRRHHARHHIGNGDSSAIMAAQRSSYWRARGGDGASGGAPPGEARGQSHHKNVQIKRSCHFVVSVYAVRSLFDIYI